MKNHYLKSQTVGRRSSCVCVQYIIVLFFCKSFYSEFTIIHMLFYRPYEDPEVDVQSFTRMKKSIYLGICYAANIGGTGTLTGTTPNLILNGMLTEYKPFFEYLSFYFSIKFLPGIRYHSPIGCSSTFQEC